MYHRPPYRPSNSVEYIIFAICYDKVGKKRQKETYKNVNFIIIPTRRALNELEYKQLGKPATKKCLSVKPTGFGFLKSDYRSKLFVKNCFQTFLSPINGSRLIKAKRMKDINKSWSQDSSTHPSTSCHRTTTATTTLTILVIMILSKKNNKIIIGSHRTIARSVSRLFLSFIIDTEWPRINLEQ